LLEFCWILLNLDRIVSGSSQNAAIFISSIFQCCFAQVKFVSSKFKFNPHPFLQPSDGSAPRCAGQHGGLPGCAWRIPGGYPLGPARPARGGVSILPSGWEESHLPHPTPLRWKYRFRALLEISKSRIFPFQKYCILSQDFQILPQPLYYSRNWCEIITDQSSILATVNVVPKGLGSSSQSDIRMSCCERVRR